MPRHPYKGKVLDFDGWKTIAHEYSARTILEGGGEFIAHDAGYDALLHLWVFYFLRPVATGNPPAMPNSELDIPESQYWSKELIETHGLAKASEISGVPEVFLNQWAKGGNARNAEWVERIRVALSAS